MTFRQKSKVRARPAAKTRLKSREAVWYNFPKEASTPNTAGRAGVPGPDGGMIMGNLIITISREFGSGGRLVGEELAKQLGIQFYDKEIIRITAEKSGLSPQFIENNEERVDKSFLFGIATAAYTDFKYATQYDVPINDKTFIAQTTVIKELAEAGDCVIVGRCADYVLRHQERLLRVFIRSELEDRISRIAKDYELESEAAESRINRNDKNRANYYRHYTGNNWGSMKNYDLMINTSFSGIDGAVDIIKAALRAKGFIE